MTSRREVNQSRFRKKYYISLSVWHSIQPIAITLTLREFRWCKQFFLNQVKSFCLTNTRSRMLPSLMLYAAQSHLHVISAQCNFLFLMSCHGKVWSGKAIRTFKKTHNSQVFVELATALCCFAIWEAIEDYCSLFNESTLAEGKIKISILSCSTSLRSNSSSSMRPTTWAPDAGPAFDEQLFNIDER